MSKTENPAHVGRHVFETAGLGKAPFICVGMTEKVHNNGDGTTKAGGCCDYCFNGIRYVFLVKSADGKTFGVGCDCINKTGDAGLMKAYKSTPEFRKLQRDKRKAKGAEARETVQKLIADNRAKLAANPHPHGFTDRQTGRALTMLDQVEWMASNCGTSGITSYAKHLPKIIQNLK